MFKLVLALTVLTQLNFAFAESEIARPFRTDKCTGYIEGTFKNPDLWAHCCVEHDFYMWAGGTKSERKQADKNLKACIVKTGHPNHAELVFLAVKAGSYSPVKLESKKWSNAWAKKRPDASLSEQEIALLEESLKSDNGGLSQEQIENYFLKIRNRN
jgi:hypothetical protein